MPKKEKNSASCPTFKTMCGGQALIEGILMRGPEKEAIVVRKPDGELEVKVEPLKAANSRKPWMKWPLVRGPVNFIDSMVHGVKALMYSAEFYPEDEDAQEEPSKLDQWLDKHLGSEKAMNVVISLSVVLGLAFSILLFFILPTLITGFLTRFIESHLLLSLLEGLVRMVIFLVYIILISNMKDMKRVFRYHGAEHQTIFCYENGLPLTVENVAKMPRHHPRCGTSFLFVIIVVSILLSSVVFSFVHVENTFARMGAHLLMLPFIVGITYEINRYVGGHDSLLCRAVRAPGMAIQRWTTFEPDDSMIEVGIRAFNEVLPQTAGADRW